MDAATLEFEDVVDTTKGTVHPTSRWRDMPPVASRPRPPKRPRTRRDKPKAAKTMAPADYLLEFGRHIGKRLGQAPPGYVRWLAETEFEQGRSPAAKAQVFARRLLGWDKNPPPVDGEYQRIVRGS